MGGRREWSVERGVWRVESREWSASKAALCAMTSAGNERYVVDKKGKPVGVLLDIRAYRKILEELEELAAIRAYDAAKASGDKAIAFDKAVTEIERTYKPAHSCPRQRKARRLQ